MPRRTATAARRKRCQTEVVSEGEDEDDEIQAVFADCTELCSPVRVNKYMKQYSMTPGSSMDLLTGWAVDRTSNRAAAASHIDEQEPRLVIGSPMCTMFRGHHGM